MIGTTLSHFKITAKLGAGGMGEVYRAEDTKLGREVAIKLLPDAVAQDPERLARFEREAKVLASLNHPNIAAIYSIETAQRAGSEAGPYEESESDVGAAHRARPSTGEDTVHFLVMELVEGETLQERCARGPIPYGEAIPIALQIAQGVEAAHERGIIHRDLKPANVKVDPEEQVKVLDFGLAKAFEQGTSTDQDPSQSPLSLSPTLTQQMTGAGVILGTAAYMSPEQAKGKAIDRRADIWAFGVLLFEMLSGQKLFRGETASETLATVMLKDPDWQLLPANVPARLRELLQRCLVKDPKQRLRDIGDARIELEQLTQTPHSASSRAVSETTQPGTPVSAPRSKGLAAAALIAGLALGALGTWWVANRVGTNRGPAAPELTKLSIPIPEDQVVGRVMISPEGRTIAYQSEPRTGVPQDAFPEAIYLRPLHSYDPVMVPGSEGSDGLAMAFSPDGKWIAYAAPSTPGSSKWQLNKAPVDGSSPPITLVEWQDAWQYNLLWLPSDDLLTLTYGPPHRLITIPADGGAPRVAVEIQSVDHKDFIGLKQVLPGGRSLLVQSSSFDGGYTESIGVVDLETGEARILIENGSQGSWSASGHLLFSRGETLLAATLDLESMTLGPPVAIADGLRTNVIWDSGEFALSLEGSLVYRPGGVTGGQRQLAFIDESGAIQPVEVDRRAYEKDLIVSPNGERFAVVLPNQSALYELWVATADRPRLTRLAWDPDADCQEGVFTPDGEQIAYTLFNVKSGSRILLRRADGTDEPTTIYNPPKEFGPSPTRAVAFSPDASLLIGQRISMAGDQTLLFDLSGQGTEVGEPTVLLEDAWGAEFSPDGRWLVYNSRASGRAEVYMRRFNEDWSLGPEVPITTAGANGFRWRDHASQSPWEMILRQDGQLFVTTVRTEPELRISELQPIAAINALREKTIAWDPHPDGRFMVILQGEDELPPGELHVVQGLQAELDRLVPKG